jgi:hypothetical protein
MYMVAILLTVLIGGTFIVCAALIPFSSKRGRGWWRWLTITASCLLVVGAGGFFGSALSAVGGLNWLPSSFEWPAGYAGGVVSTPEGLHVVPHTPSGRIQVYDANWTFVTGWHVDAAGGTFKLLAPAEGHIAVITARGQWQYVFDMDGRLISKNSYRPESYGSFPEEGVSVVVPTAPWLWVFSNPVISWAVGATGMVMLIVIRLAGRREAATDSYGTARC